jgi:5'-phosphate synthase pdxT subunit
LMDIRVVRNAFGRQVDSFEVDLDIQSLGMLPVPQPPYHAFFIRAPIIESVGDTGQALAYLPDGSIVAARQGKLLATCFHPELTTDTRFHAYFLSIAKP